MPKTIQFTDKSTPGQSGPITSWHWDFGDGESSTDQNPSHDYSIAGIFDVQLRVTGSGSDGTDDVVKQVTVVISELTALFSASNSDLTVDFTDHSQAGESGPITDWLWDFGDGETSTDQNPSHNYASPGVYNVQLTVTGTGADGTDTVIRSVAVTVASVLTSLFTSDISGSLVSFTDHSTPGSSGPITNWLWDFGDGTTSTTPNPTHGYTDSDTYTVTLTVTGTGTDGTDDISHDVTVVVPSGGTTIFDQFINASNFARAPFTPTRIVRFKDKAGFDAALAGLQAGDLVKYDPNFFGLSNRSLKLGAYQIKNKSLSKRTVIDLGCSHNVWDNSKITPNYVEFDTITKYVPGLFFADNKNLDIWGGDYHSDHGGGFRIMGNITDCQLLDLYCHDIGGSGVMVQPVDSSTGVSRTQDGLVIRAEINRFAMDPSTDNHPDKGTGFHGALHHGASGKLDNSHFYYYAHDSLRPGETSFGVTYPEGGGGSACETGTDNTGAFASQNTNHYTVYGENLLMTPSHGAVVNPGSTSSQTGGNLINNWGSVPMNGNVYDFLGGKKLAGAIFHGAGGNWHNATPAIKVLVGRGEQTNLFVGGGGNTAERYVSGKGITYVDCT